MSPNSKTSAAPALYEVVTTTHSFRHGEKPSMDSTNLDFLRASAVMMVLLFHIFDFFGIKRFGPFEPQAMGGFGVLLFFIHTSFVLMLSLERQIASFGRRRLFLVFMLRRCFRIYPLSIFVVAVITILKLRLGGTPWSLDWYSLRSVDVLSNILLTQNLTSSPSIPGPLWSLPFEIQMYLVLPGLFLLARRCKSPWTGVLGWLAVTALVLACVRLGHGYRVKYVPCFAAGVLAYRFSTSVPRQLASWVWPVLLWSAVIVFMLIGRLEAAWWFCLAIGMVVPRCSEMSHTLVRRASHLIAKYSYGIYLTHVVCIWLAFVQLRMLPVAGQWVALAATLAGIPVLLYHFLESPLINAGKKLAESWLVPARLQSVAGEAA
jgi:peptidoglycan/LPS O-acetylase OafA/YrhL